jgi:hypothetical protein
MLAGGLIFYARGKDENVLEIDMETIELDTYLHSVEFHDLIENMVIERVISSVYYSNGAPVEIVVYPFIQ